MVNQRRLLTKLRTAPSRGGRLRHSALALATATLAALLYPARVPSQAKPTRGGEAQRVAKPELVVQTGHTSPVRGAAFSPDGTKVLTVSEDKTARLWSLGGLLLRKFEGHTWWVTSVAFSPDGTKVLTGSDDNTARLWSLQGQLLKKFEGHTSNVNSVAFSPDGTKVLTGSDDNTARLWSLGGQLLKKFEGHTWWVKSVAFSPDGTKVLTGSYDKTARFWSGGGQLLRTFEGHAEAVHRAVFSPDGTKVLTGSWDNTARLWSIEGHLLRKFEGHKDSVESVAFSPDGTKVLTGSWDNTARLWSIEGHLLRKFEGHSKSVESAAFSPDGTKALTGSEDNTARLWSIEGHLLRKFEGHSKSVYGVAFAPDGTKVLTGSNTARLWSLGGQLLQKFEGHSGSVKSVAFSPDGTKVLTGPRGLHDETARLWSLHGQLLQEFEGHTWWVESVAFSPDGTKVLTGSYDKTARLWSLGGQLLRTFEGHTGSVESAAFSPDGTKVLTGSDDNTARLWSLGGQLLQKFEGHSGSVKSVAFSPDGTKVLTGSSDNTARLWSLQGQLLRKFEGHTWWVNSVAYSPDGTIVLTGSSDATTRLWSAETGQEIAAFIAFTDGRYIVRTPDGYWDASANSGDGVAMVEGLEAFGVDQFALRNNRPDIILERLGSKDRALIAHYKQRYLKRLQKAGFTEAQLSGELHVPEAKIHSTKTSGKFVDLRFTILDSKYSLRSYNIYVNGVPLFVGGRPTSGRSREITERIELTEGDNRIEVSVLNEKGAESYRALTFASYAGKVTPDLYYIGFGVSQYRNPRLNLRYADKDVEDLRAHLQRMQATGRFRKVHARIFTNEEVTPENIRRAKDLLKGARVDDVFVLSISGHGMHDRDDTCYFLTHGADPGNLSKTAANFELVEDLLHGIGPRRKLFLMDTCESGEVEKGSTGKVESGKAGGKEEDTKLAKGLRARTARGVLVQLAKQKLFLADRNRYIYNDLFRRSGAVVFSSSQGTEASLEKDEFRRGLFTHAVIGALLGGGDADKDGVVSLEELKAFVMKRVPELSGNAQHPTVDRDNVHARIGFPVVK